jgi:hypothetical protein
VTAPRALSRREFVLGAAAAVAACTAMRGSAPDARVLTAREVAERARASLGVPWREPTVDGFKAGDPTYAGEPFAAVR